MRILFAFLMFGHRCDSIPEIYGIGDSSYEAMSIRKKELEDSIRMIRKQNKFLDSLNHTLDTVKWTPYYYKHKSHTFKD